jgi:hypothetical protein
MECVVVKLKEAITDPNNSLPVLGGIRFKINPSAASTLKVSTFRLTVINDGVTVTVSSGNFYSDTAGTVSLGKTVVRTTSSPTLYFKPDNLVDIIYVTIRNSANLVAMGASAENSQWGPTSQFIADTSNGVLPYKVIIDADEFYNLPNLKNFVIGAGTFDIINVKQVHVNQLTSLKVLMAPDIYLVENVEITGTASVIRGINAGKNSAGSLGNTLTVDLNKTDLLNIEVGNTVNVIYTGTGATALSTGTIMYVSINTTIASSAQFDNLIKALALSTFQSTMLTCRLLGTRTSASDAALATLRTKVPAGKLYINNVLEN